MSYDVTLTEDDEVKGGVMMHKPDCPVVQAHREAGRLICTMIDCETPTWPRSVKVRQHSCLGSPGHGEPARRV